MLYVRRISEVTSVDLCFVSAVLYTLWCGRNKQAELITAISEALKELSSAWDMACWQQNTSMPACRDQKQPGSSSTLHHRPFPCPDPPSGVLAADMKDEVDVVLSVSKSAPITRLARGDRIQKRDSTGQVLASCEN